MRMYSSTVVRHVVVSSMQRVVRVLPPSVCTTTTRITTALPPCVGIQCRSSSFSSVARRHPNNSDDDDDDKNDTTDTAVTLSPSRSADVAVEVLDLQSSTDIQGEESQIAIVTLQPGQVLRAESGSMIYMTDGVQMQTSLSTSDDGQGMMSTAMKRLVTGQNLMVTDFTYKRQDSNDDDSSKAKTTTTGTVALGTDFPSKIIRLRLNDYPNSTLICQKGAYLASTTSVNIEMAFTKSFTSGFFGGEGFVLQKLQGGGHDGRNNDDVLIKAGGTLVTKELEAGETLRVTSGSLVAFTDTVDYDVQMVKGAKNVIFGGEGLFLTTLRGPGTVWLQGMPADRMVSEIMRRMPVGGGGLGLGIPIGMGGGSDAESASGDEAVQPEGAEEDMTSVAAATDAAVDADRQATVASSATTTTDPDSPSALFGDAAASTPPHDATIASDTPPVEDTTFDDDSSSSFDETQQTSNEPTFADDSGFGEESFSTQDSFEEQEDLFQDDSTSFSTYEGDSSSSSSTMSDAVSDAAEDGGDGGVGSILSTIWDLFMGGDD